MTLSEYIKRLQALEENNGHLPVVMTQSGYYAESRFADLFDFPEIRTILLGIGEYNQSDSFGDREKVSKQVYVILGHSHQSY